MKSKLQFMFYIKKLIQILLKQFHDTNGFKLNLINIIDSNNYVTEQKQSWIYLIYINTDLND